MWTRTKLYNLIKTLKIFVWEELLQIINMCYGTMLWALLLQPYPKSTINSKVFFYCSTVSWFHFTSLYNKDTDSLIYRFVLAGRSRSVALRSFKYF